MRARSRGGEWLVRIEDLDSTRCDPRHSRTILAQLAACGLDPDAPPVYQSERRDAYAEAIESLREKGAIYPCGCTRKEIGAQANDGIYPGTCRNGLLPGRQPRSLRLRCEQAPLVTFEDAIHGPCCQNLAETVGDFVVQRADGLHAYQLAVVVDDAWQGISEVVRGADLLDNTPRQIWLQRLLDLPTPAYAHLPLLLNPDGSKLSKQSRAAPFDLDNPVPALHFALDVLGQQPPDELQHASVVELLDWAVMHWNESRLRNNRYLS